MKFSTLVVIGFPYGHGKHPSEYTSKIIKDVNYLHQNVSSSILLVDRAYECMKGEIESISSDVVVIPDYPSCVFLHRIHPDAPENIKLSPYSDNVIPLQQSNLEVAYVDVTPVSERSCSTRFELAALVKTETFNSKIFALSPENLIQAGDADFSPLPDFFNGKKDVLKSKIIHTAEFKNLILEGIDCVRACLSAGFHLGKNSSPVPGWCLQTGGVWYTLLISLFKIIPGAHDRFLFDDVLESSSLRRLLVSASISVLANLCFCVLKIVSVEMIEKTGSKADDEAWSNQGLWSEIRSKI